MKATTSITTVAKIGAFSLFLLLLLLLRPAAEARAETDLLGSREKFFQPKLGARVPRDLRFADETGKEVQLGDYGKERPVILVLAYYRCPRLCTLVLNDLVTGLKGIYFNAGQEFEVVVVSFDPREKPELAAAKKRAYVEDYGRPGTEKGWHFLTGEQEQIDALMDAVGFRAVWDEREQQFAHARGILFLTGDWMVTRYFLEGTYPPRDMRLALVDASEGKVGSPMDRVLLMCFNYNPVEGRYSLTVLNVVRLGGGLTMGLVGLFWLGCWLRGKKNLPPEQPPSRSGKGEPETLASSPPEESALLAPPFPLREGGGGLGGELVPPTSRGVGPPTPGEVSSSGKEPAR